MASFPRAKIIRFNEVAGGAPPPGRYEPKSSEKVICGKFNNSKRFSEPKPQVSRSRCSDASNSLFHSQLPKEATTSENSKVTQEENGISKLRSFDGLPECKEGQIFCTKKSNKSDAEMTDPAGVQSDVSNRHNLTRKQQIRLRNVCHRSGVESMEEISVASHVVVKKMLQEVRESMKDIENSMLNFKERNDDLENEVERLKEERQIHVRLICEDINDEFKDMYKKINAANALSAKLKKQIVVKKNTIEDNHKKIKELQSRLSVENARSDHLRAEIDDAYKEINVFEERRKQLTLDSIQLRQSLETKVAENQALSKKMCRLSYEKNEEIWRARQDHAKITNLLCLLQDNVESKEKMFISTVNNVERMMEGICDPIDGMGSISTGESNGSNINNIPMTRPVNGEGSDDELQSKSSHLLYLIGRLEKMTTEYQAEQLKSSDLKEKVDEVNKLKCLDGPCCEELEHYEQEYQAQL